MTIALYVYPTYSATMTLSPVDVQQVPFVVVADESTWNITKHRSVRLEDNLWKRLKPAARAIGFDRAGVIRQFVRWYLRIPGAELPQRPELPGGGWPMED